MNCLVGAEPQKKNKTKSIEDGILLYRGENNPRVSWKCAMCSPKTIERKNANKKDRFHFIMQSATGLKCSMCSRVTCRSCLEKVRREIKRNIAATDPWCLNIDSFLHSEKETESPQDFTGFIGHCCELRIWRKAYKKPPITNAMKLDGSLHLPEFNLLINSPLGNGGPVDIHGMGQDTNLPAVVHCVLSPTLCAEICKRKIIPTGNAASYFRLGVDKNFQIDIQLPYSTKTKNVGDPFDKYNIHFF